MKQLAIMQQAIGMQHNGEPTADKTLTRSRKARIALRELMRLRSPGAGIALEALTGGYELPPELQAGYLKRIEKAKPAVVADFLLALESASKSPGRFDETRTTYRDAPRTALALDENEVAVLVHTMEREEDRIETVYKIMIGNAIIGLVGAAATGLFSFPIASAAIALVSVGIIITGLIYTNTRPKHIKDAVFRIIDMQLPREAREIIEDMEATHQIRYEQNTDVTGNPFSDPALIGHEHDPRYI